MSTALRISRWMSGILLLLILLALLLLYAAPGIGLAFARHWYAQQGEGYELQASGWSFSPFATRFSLSGLKLKHPDTGNGESRIGKLDIHLNPYAMLDRRIEVSRVRLADVDLRPALVDGDNGQQLTIAGLTLPLEASETSAPDNAEASDQPQTQTSEQVATDGGVEPWHFAVNSIELDNQQLGWSVSLPSLNTDGRIVIKKIMLTDLNSDNRPIKADISLQLPQLSLTTETEGAGGEATPSTVVLTPGAANEALQLTLNGQLFQPLTAPQWQGDMTLDGLVLSTNQNGDMRVTLTELALRGIEADATQQSIAQIQLTDLNILQGGDSLLALARYQLNGLSYAANNISVGDQSYQGLVVHAPDLYQAPADAASGDSASAETPPDKAAVTSADAVTDAPANATAEAVSQALAFVLSGLHQGEQGAEIFLRDSGVSPPMTGTLTLHEVDLGEVDGQLQQTLQLSKPISLHLLAGLDDYNRIQLDGDLSVFERDGQLFPQGSVKASIGQLDLVQFNGYLGKAMGYHVERGMLNMDADIQFDQAQLSGEVNILLRNARFVPADEEAIERLSKQISMPVDTALDLLRDDNGNVRLSIPLAGDLSDPDVGLNDLTRQLSKLALKQGAMYYLRQSLQPYTTVLTVASYAGDYLFAIRLDDLLFAPDSAELTAEHTEHLQKVASLMQGKTGLELQVCPFVSKEEAANQGEQWPQLAKARGAAVKAWLAGFDDEQGNSLAQRVSLCKPQQGDTGSVVMGVE